MRYRFKAPVLAATSTAIIDDVLNGIREKIYAASYDIELEIKVETFTLNFAEIQLTGINTSTFIKLVNRLESVFAFRDEVLATAARDPLKAELCKKIIQPLPTLKNAYDLMKQAQERPRRRKPPFASNPPFA